MEENQAGSIFEKTMNSLNWFFSNVVFFCLFFMTFYVTLDIIIRTISGSALEGTVEINEYLLVIVGFLGMVHTNRHRGHITVDLLYNRISPTKQYLLDQINNIILLGFSILFVYAGFQKAMSAYESGESSWFGDYILPVWFIRWIVPIGFTLLSLQLLIGIFQLKKRRSSSNE